MSEKAIQKPKVVWVVFHNLYDFYYRNNYPAGIFESELNARRFCKEKNNNNQCPPKGDDYGYFQGEDFTVERWELND